MNLRTASVCTSDHEAAATADLLHKLAWDDEFRARFANSPGDVLAEYRLSAPADLPVALTLPTKEEALRTLSQAVACGTLHDPDDFNVFAWFC